MVEAEGLLKELRDSNEKLNDGLSDIADITHQVSKGEGTAHALIYEREMYDTANQLLKDAGEAAKAAADLAAYLKENPSDLVWGPEPVWYKKWWRGLLSWFSGEKDEDAEKPEKEPRPKRETGRRSTRRKSLNLLEAPQ
jgi:hypothetical protein